MNRPASPLPLFAAAAVAVLGALGGCTCGEPAPEQAFEIGAALKSLPAAGSAPLAEICPGELAAYVQIDAPERVLAELQASPRLSPLLSPSLLGNVALSDAGATTHALRMRLAELAQLPLPDGWLAALLDGPLALGARTTDEGTDVVLLKRLGPKVQASWRLAEVLQSVHPSLREVRVERYRGIPLRKVLLDQKRRLTYFVLRDLLVAGTSEAMVKRSLDLALGHGRANAAAQPAVRLALSESPSAALVAVLDAEALRSQTAKPPLAATVLAQARWVRATLVAGRPLQLTLAQAAPLPRIEAKAPLLFRYAPAGAIAAGSRALDLGAALGALSPTDKAGPESRALFEALHGALEGRLGREAFWFASPADDGTPARHLVGFALLDAAAVRAQLPALLPRVLAPPLTEDLDGRQSIHCGGEGQDVCVAATDDALLVSTGPEALRDALAVARGHLTPVLKADATGGADALFLDARVLSELLGRANAGSPDAQARLAPLLKAVKGMGALAATLRPVREGVVSGEVRWP